MNAIALIDGEHHHPTPTLDWYYTARGLQRGAVVVVDDVQLPAPRLVADYMAGLSPFRTVATLRLFREDIAPRTEAGNNLSFTVWHTTADHRPLGGLNRLRRENRQLRLEREILSKATAWFAREANRIPPQDSDS